MLGEHVKQAGSLVSPDRLRFDFSHYDAVTSEEIRQIEILANQEVLNNTAVSAIETNKEDAMAGGAIAFFGDKYGDLVRVLRAGSSTELCGGTHVKATGDIGTIKVISEGSIGSNLRRLEAVTGQQTISYMQRTDAMVNKVSERVGGRPEDILAGVERRLEEMKLLQDEMKSLRSQINATRAADFIEQVVDGVVVGRVDGLSATDLRELGVAIRQHPQVLVVVLGGITDTGGVSLVAAIASGVKITAQEIIKDAAKKVGGGGGGKGDVATAGGKNIEAIDEALEIARQHAMSAVRGH